MILFIFLEGLWLLGGDLITGQGWAQDAHREGNHGSNSV